MVRALATNSCRTSARPTRFVPRWGGVPFLLRHGKRLPKRFTEVQVQFRTPPLQLFNRPEDMAEADDIFTKLMGDVVEPRREFIQQNALSVENLDF